MCDTLVAVGDATADGSVILAKNSDRQPNEAHVLAHIARAHHEAGETVKCTYLEVPQVPDTYEVLLSKPFWIWGGEMGANECGVSIGNEAVFTREPYDKEPGLIGMDMLRPARPWRSYSISWKPKGKAETAAFTTRNTTITPSSSPTRPRPGCWRQQAASGQPSEYGACAPSPTG